jgi:hypothetical protein
VAVTLPPLFRDHFPVHAPRVGILTVHFAYSAAGYSNSDGTAIESSAMHFPDRLRTSNEVYDDNQGVVGSSQKEAAGHTDANTSRKIAINSE